MGEFTGGDVVAAALQEAGVEAAFGVISIHNMPILDAIARGRKIRFVPSRGEAGAVNMADAFARAKSGLGVAVTSTGTGAGNAAGAIIEAASAGSPVLHLTGQVETAYLDRNMGALHDTRDQLGMLRAISKAAFRAQSVEELGGVLKSAIGAALTAPMGPVSVEIPIDVQWATVPKLPDVRAVVPRSVSVSSKSLETVAGILARSKRPLIWAGGGARRAEKGIRALCDLGFGIVTSVNGRGVVPENHPASLGAYCFSPAVEELYSECDAILVCGSRLRSNETLQHMLRLPRPLIVIDIDPLAENRTYKCDEFILGDCAEVLEGLATRLAGRIEVDGDFGQKLSAARRKAEAGLRKAVGPYAKLADALAQWMPERAPWVRDITIAGTTWGHRMPSLSHSWQGIHALGGGIGQGLPMSIGAAIALPDTKVAALVGDGGLLLSLGELTTMVQEKVGVVLIVMNDRGYGVIRNIQDRDHGGRRAYVDLLGPNYEQLCAAIGLGYCRVVHEDQFQEIVGRAFKGDGPILIEVDMDKVGPFAQAFAGPARRSPN